VLRLCSSKVIFVLCFKLLHATAGRNIRLMVWWIEMFCNVIKRKISPQAILSILPSANFCSSVSPLLIFALNSIGLLEMVRVTWSTQCHLSSKSGTQNRVNIGTRCLRYVYPSVNKPSLASLLQIPNSEEHGSSEIQQRRPFPQAN
jgi:hypothetical protein